MLFTDPISRCTPPAVRHPKDDPGQGHSQAAGNPDLRACRYDYQRTDLSCLRGLSISLIDSCPSKALLAPHAANFESPRSSRTSG